ncbi:hypothetical protein [Sphingobium subterraneum]|uniref:hypothetical protein n=1 Tax=Sphingobium subterraneum TaxID=627688 RepID=UPI001C850D26|nr:hypothetical protein [Sphingobium subterraneum]
MTGAARQVIEVTGWESSQSASISRLLRVLLLILSIVLASPAIADPSFSLDQTTANLPVNGDAGEFTFGLSATGLDPAAKNELVVSDFGPTGPTVIIIPSRISASGANALWKISGKVTGFAASEAQARHLTLTLDGKPLSSLAYTIKNTAPGDFTWTVSGLSDKRLSNIDDDLKFVVQIGNVPAHNVRLVQTDLIGTDNLTPLPTTFDLCRAEHPDDCSLTTLAAGTSYALLLRAKDKTNASAGQYSGTILLVADEKPLGEPMPIHVVVSSTCARWFGFILICIGVALAIAINPFARALVARDDALRPAFVLRERVIDWETRLAEVRKEAGDPKLKCATDLLKDLKTKLSATELKRNRLVPRAFAAFYSPTPSPAAAATYQALLTTAANQLGSLAVVVETGIRPALVIENAATFPDLVADAIDGPGGLDEILKKPDVAPGDALDKAIADRLAKLRSDLAEEAKNNAGLAVVDAPTLDPMREPTVRELDFQVAALNVIGWLFFSIGSILLGSLVLLILNPAFGSLQDYVICLLWGFGVPTAGTQVTSLGQGSIASSLGVKLVG